MLNNKQVMKNSANNIDMFIEIDIRTVYGTCIFILHSIYMFSISGV